MATIEDFNKLLAAFQQLQQDNIGLHNANKNLQSAVSQLQVSLQNTSQGPSLYQAPKISLPDKFDGSKQKYRGFVNQVRLYIRMQPGQFPNGDSKVGLLGSLLSGPALSWFAPLLENLDPVLSDFDAFLTEFEASFGNSDKVRIASTKIRNLSQGSHPASTYASEFRQLAGDLNWGQEALIDQFCTGLKDDVKDLLLTTPDPTTLNDAISTAIRCDNCLFEHRQECRQEHQFENPPAPARNSPTPTTSNGDAMQLDAVHPRTLSAHEKERRRANNLCLYCGGSGHFAQNCPLKRSTSNRISSLSPLGNATVQPQ